MPPVLGLSVGVSEPRSFWSGQRRHRFEPLPAAATDAVRTARLLVDLAQSAGLDLEIPVLTGSAATCEAITSAIKHALVELDEGGLFLFVFQGHGIEVPDIDHDEMGLGHLMDEIFPTATEPMLDDDFALLWKARPDISIFTITDSCHAESGTVAFDIVRAPRGARALHTSARPSVNRTPLIKQLITPGAGPSILQFAASQRDAETDEIEVPGGTSGRFTQAILEAASNFRNLVSYLDWFTAANAIINGASVQVPVLYYKGPDAAMILQRPVFVPPTVQPD